MISSKTLKEIVSEARPIIERQLDDAERIAAFREVVTEQGGDWSSLKALIKAQIQDERDEGSRVKKILDKAEFATGYADMLGWSKMNENNFSAEEEFDPITGEFVDSDVVLIDREDEDGNHLTVTVDARVAAILNKSAAQPLQSPRKAAEAVSERTAIDRNDDMPVVANGDVHRDTGSAMARTEASAVTAGETATQFHAKASDDACEAGRKALGRAEASADAPDGAELVSRGVGDRAPTATSEAMDVTGGESAATSCEYCDDTGDVHRIDGEWLGFCHCEHGKRLQGASEIEIDPSEDRSEGQSLGGGLNAVDANTGGRHVDGSAVRADTSNTAGGTVSNPPAKSIRPNCLRPENCGGYGSNHCFSCKRAAKANEEEVAA